MTMYDGRLNLSKQVVEEVDSFFKKELFKTFIHRNVRLSIDSQFGKPALLYDANSLELKVRSNRGDSSACQLNGLEKDWKL